ncbi:MAG TPA: outer membrane beta-barrel protein [Pedobacter sp.]|jgi:opacity protein-like surface antigen
MKKILLVTVLAVAGLTASAQTEKGRVTLGGTLSYESSKSEADDSYDPSAFTILPTFSYFVANNISLGLGLGYTSSKVAKLSGVRNGIPTFSKIKTSAVVVYPFGRSYKSLSEQFKFFGELGVPLAFGSTEVNGQDSGGSTSIGVSLSPGFAFFPTKRVAIELGFNGINYISTTLKDNDGKKIDNSGSSSFSIGADFFAPKLGVQFHF